MATTIARLTRNHLARRVLRLREHNHRIQQELLTILDEKAALEDKFHISIEHLEEESSSKARTGKMGR